MRRINDTVVGIEKTNEEQWTLRDLKRHKDTLQAQKARIQAEIEAVTAQIVEARSLGVNEEV